MKKSKTVILIIAAIAAVLCIGRIVIGQVAEKQLRKALADIPETKIDFKDLRFSLLAGNFEVHNINVTRTDSTNVNPEINGSIGAIKLEKLHWRALLRGVAMVDRAIIKDGEVGMKGQKDSLKFHAQAINILACNIKVKLDSGSVEYNDSTYAVSLDSLDFIDSSGLSRIRIGHLSTADAGAIKAHGLRFYNCVGKEEVAERSGKVASMWYDAQLDTMYISPLNIPRMVKSEQVNIDSVYVSGPSVVIFQDDRYPPAVPYPTMQEGANAAELPIHIRQINAKLRAFTFIWETTHVNRGSIPMHNVNLGITSVSNAPGNLMKMSLRSGLPGRSSMALNLNIRNDKKESTSGTLKISNLEASRLDQFLRPLFGATASADIQKIDCSFKGDKNQVTTDFCMLYSNLSVHACDDANAPFKIVAKNSGAINFLANLFLPKSNPLVQGQEPKRVEYTVKRDPMLPYPTYIIQNLTMGMMHTVLPGSEVKK